jgi:hypothetical protein
MTRERRLPTFWKPQSGVSQRCQTSQCAVQPDASSSCCRLPMVQAIQRHGPMPCLGFGVQKTQPQVVRRTSSEMPNPSSDRGQKLNFTIKDHAEADVWIFTGLSFISTHPPHPSSTPSIIHPIHHPPHPSSTHPLFPHLLTPHPLTPHSLTPHPLTPYPLTPHPSSILILSS